MITRKPTVSSRLATVLALVAFFAPWYLTVLWFPLSAATGAEAASAGSGQRPNLLAAATGDESANSGPTDKAAPEKRQGDEEYYELFGLFADTLDQVDRNYVKDISRRKLIEAAIRGMLSELDPYSDYIAPEQLDRFKTGVESEFGGVGIQVSMENGVLRVISPLVGSPAYRAGVLADDVILEIDGKATKGISLDESVRLMKGAVGTKVTLKVQHADKPEPETMVLDRENVRMQTVMGDTRNSDDSWDWMFDDERKIGYVRVTGFGRHTTEELRAAMKTLTDQNMRGLILDLRFNPGGLLTTAIEVSDLFVSKGRIVSVEGRNTQPRSWEAQEKDTFDGFPMAVLVNRFSASASEIVAACLQDHNRAAVIGERTWGKGTVQNVIEMERGTSALKLTTAAYHRPNGKSIHRFADSKDTDEWGVSPNDGLEVKLTRPELERLMAVRHEKSILRKPKDPAPQATEGPNGAQTEAAASEAFVDPQLQKALDYVQQKIETAKADDPATAKAAG